MANNKDLRTKKGVYEIDGSRYPSVTTIIRETLKKEGLERWMAGQIYDLLRYRPTLPKQRALSMVLQPSNAEMQIGTAVHAIVENHEPGDEYLSIIPDDFVGYALAYRKFVEDYGFEDISKEQTLISKQYGYAGTYDRFGKIKTGKNTLIDIKTGKQLYSDVYIQLSAYKQLLKENLDAQVDEIAGLLLKSDGTYEYQAGEDILPVFLGLKSVWDWRDKEEVKKT